MPMSRPPYPPEFRAEMERLVRCGHTPEELAEQFEPIAQTIRNWARAADAKASVARGEGLTEEEREELRQLRRRVKQLEDERKTLHEPAVRSCFDNAVSESLFAARECEPIDQQSAFPTDERAVVFDLIEGW